MVGYMCKMTRSVVKMHINFDTRGSLKGFTPITRGFSVIITIIRPRRIRIQIRDLPNLNKIYKSWKAKIGYKATEPETKT